MHLDRAKGLGQADAAAFLFGRKIQIKNLFAHLGGDAFAFVTDYHFYLMVVDACGCERQLPACGHCLTSIDDDVEQSLLEHINVGFNLERIAGVPGYDLNFTVRINGREQHHFAQYFIRIIFARLHLYRARKIEKGLDDTIQAINLGSQNLNVRAGIASGLKFGAQQFQVEHHRVQRVFDFVGNAGGDAAERGNPCCVIKLCFQALQ